MIPPRHILLLFVDGIGLPPEPLSESVYAPCPTLCRLMSDHCVPLDACLGVPGLPQSATGQTALFTGVNAAARMGRHCEGFPVAELRGIIEAGNLLSRLHAAGRRCTFANAYASRPGKQLPMMFRSVTTVMTLHAIGDTRNRQALLEDRAVYHDITREILPSHGVEGVPMVSEKNAGRHLLEVMRTVDFCLFEYFLTDRVGHRGTFSERQRVLGSLDRFVTACVDGLDHESELLLMVSDHGNIEDLDRRGHTCHPVPWIAIGRGARAARTDMASLTDVTPRILEVAGAVTGCEEA